MAEIIKVNQKELLQMVGEALTNKFKDELKGYNSKISDIMNRVISQNQPMIEKQLNDALSDVLNDEEFSVMLKQEFKRKVAKTLVGKLEGSVEKAVDTYRNNPVVKAKMIMALENVINSEK